MHHRGCTRARVINLHFIIFYDAFNNDAVPSADPGRAGEWEKGVSKISSTVYFTTLAPTLQFHSY